MEKRKFVKTFESYSSKNNKVNEEALTIATITAAYLAKVLWILGGVIVGSGGAIFAGYMQSWYMDKDKNKPTVEEAMADGLKKAKINDEETINMVFKTFKRKYPTEMSANRKLY